MPRALLVSNLTKMATKALHVIDEVIAMLPALDKDERAFVADYRRQVVARCERYLDMASEVKAVEL